jgi:hypothetical protein
VASVTYLVFGDLHGRVLPAFRLAAAWQRGHGERLAGLLQVGDLGYFPDPTRLDEATRRHAEKDPSELGVLLITAPSRQAEAVFADPDAPPALWFTAGNHEDYDALERTARGRGATADDFPVDAYGRVRCLRNGGVATLPGGLRVGALWGIDGEAPQARRRAPPGGRVSGRAATHLSYERFDVLLTHESPRDFARPDSGSESISLVLLAARPALAFFGHYHPRGLLCGEVGSTRVYHLHGLEFRGPGRTAEEGSVGVLRWGDGGARFEYAAADWLRTMTRPNGADR